ncbi:MAG: peptidylprolyl isomerase [Acidimicrobiales bacterium]
MPTEKRARQKAARRKKRAAQARKVRTRRRLRSGGLLAGGAAAVLLLVLFSAGVFSGSPSKPTSGAKKPKTETAATTQSAANKAAVAAGCKSSPTARANTLSWKTPPAMSIGTTKTYTATVETTAGSFTITLDATTAPTTVNNFVFLADQGFYDCNTFHRVIPGFMDQTGDPTGTGSGGPGYEFANENVPTQYESGDVAMANSGGTDTNGSQFFVVDPGGASTLDTDLKTGDGYSLFGKVTSGMSVVKKINSLGGTTATGKPKVTERILKITVHSS